MPTYEYACKTCGKEFEHFQSIKADALTVCDCGKGGELRRKIGRGAGIIFKGSGFYETDYKRQASPPSSETTPKTDSKPDAKPEAKPASTPAPTAPAS